MAERSGFYPSNPKEGIVNEYKGYEFGNVYKRIISNGVFATNEGTPSSDLQVVANGGLSVVLKPGEGIFLNQWYINDEDITFNLDYESNLNRIDLIVIEANKLSNVLSSKAKVVKGTPAAVPVAPTVIDTDMVKQYPVASIYVRAGVSTITQSVITDLRGTAPTLWITSLIQQVDTSTLFTQFETSFWEWFDNVKDTLSTTTLMRKYTGYVNTTVENQTQITIPISEYNSVLDILQVHIEGRILREGIDYVKNGFTGITLTQALPVVNTLIYFEIFKSVDGSDAETIAALLYALQDRMDKSIVTSDTGSDKLVIVSNLGQEVLNAGVGFHTLQVPNTANGVPLSNKSWRGFASFTTSTRGYVLIISNDGDVYLINYNSSWGAWRCLYTNNNVLVERNALMISGQSAIPPKKLSECRNGWMLVWRKFTSGVLSDGYYTTLIPKVNTAGEVWSGQTFLVSVPYDINETTGVVSYANKKLTITDTTITGSAVNGVGNNVNIVLGGVYEY